MTLLGVRVQNHPQQTAARGACDATDDRETLLEHFAEFDRQFGPFTLDVAAAPHNAKCEEFYTREQDALIMPWRGVVWCNPPYSDIGAWVRKAWREIRSPYCERIVMLLPNNRCEQGWWQTEVEPFRDGGYQSMGQLRVVFLAGRMRFLRPGVEIGPNGDRPPFGNCLLIWTPPAPPVSSVLPVGGLTKGNQR